MSCPSCKRKSAPKKDGNKSFPFCSERCLMADLGRWLNEEYRVPDDDEAPSPPPDDGGTN